MPNRILRDGILESRRVDALSVNAELFYRRLMSVVDDYGRFYGDPELLRSRCFPRRIDKIDNADISKWVAECAKAGLLKSHETTKGPILEMIDFGQPVRTLKSKFPLDGDKTRHKAKK